MAIFSRYTPLVEPLSVDEAFLDVSGCRELFGSPVEIAARIQEEIEAELGLTASVGVAPNKFLAKLASDLNKPRGLTVIAPGQVQAVLSPLPVERLWGVGEKTAEKLRKLGIATIGQLARMPQSMLAASFGKVGATLWHLARGEDFRVVEPNRKVKSISRETTFSQDLQDMARLKAVILELADDVASSLRASQCAAGTVTLKIRYGNFETITRQEALPTPACLTNPIYSKALELLAKVDARGRGIRLVGVGASRLVSSKQRQLDFFDGGLDQDEKIAKTLDRVAERFGGDAVRRAALLKDRGDK